MVFLSFSSIPGVLWTGRKQVDRASETINYLKSKGKQIFYVTNNSTKTRDQYLTKLTQLGFQAEKDEIATSGFLVASYLESIGFSKKVYLIGSEGLANELDNHGIQHTNPGPDPMLSNAQTYLSQEFSFDEDIGAVVVGFDEFISYPKILKAANYVKNPDCLFLATNSDETFPMGDSLVTPGTGTMVAAVETACTPRKAQIFGKPFKPMFEAISRRANIDPQRTLMVGDRCNTDISFGNSCGIKTLLVLSGVTSLEQLKEYEAKQQCNLIPQYFTNQLGDILMFLERSQK